MNKHASNTGIPGWRPFRFAAETRLRSAANDLQLVASRIPLAIIEFLKINCFNNVTRDKIFCNRIQVELK
jgi:hypothetical protein